MDFGNTNYYQVFFPTNQAKRKGSIRVLKVAKYSRSPLYPIFQTLWKWPVPESTPTTSSGRRPRLLSPPPPEPLLPPPTLLPFSSKTLTGPTPTRSLLSLFLSLKPTPSSLEFIVNLYVWFSGTYDLHLGSTWGREGEGAPESAEVVAGIRGFAGKFQGGASHGFRAFLHSSARGRCQRCASGRSLYHFHRFCLLNLFDCGLFVVFILQKFSLDCI